MKVFGLAALLVVGFFASVLSYETDGDVLVLNDDTFDQAIKEYDTLLVEFYAPWCGHCKKLEPEYSKAATTLAQRDPPLHIAKVDATVAKKLAETQGIRGFPTIKLFKHGSPSEYQGDRTADAIVNFMVKKSGPPVTTLTTVAEAESFLSSNEKAGIAFFSSLKSDLAEKFKTFAAKFDNYPFAYTESSAVEEKYAAEKGSLYFSTPEGPSTTSLVGLEDEELSTWIFGHAIPLLAEFEPAKSRELFSGPIRVHLLAFLDNESAEFEPLSAAIKAAVTKTRTKHLTVYMPKSQDRILQAFDLTADDVPKVVIADLSGGSMKKYFLDDAISQASVEGFVSKFLNGELKPALKSEEPSAEDWAGPVKVVKGLSFKEKVIDSDDDVLLEFYAPWCGHCKQLEPKYTELAEKLAGSEKLVIAKIDATANEIDHPGVSVSGYPTILFFKAGQKDTPIPYESSREVTGFISWLKQHATVPPTVAVGGDAAEEDEDEGDEEENDEL